jgi:hypothetical protein
MSGDNTEPRKQAIVVRNSVRGDTMASRTVVAAIAGVVVGVVVGYFAFSPKNGSSTAPETVRVEPPIRNPPDHYQIQRGAQMPEENPGSATTPAGPSSDTSR